MMLRISTLMGESIMFFISLSIFSILSLSLFLPLANIGYQSARYEYLDGYSRGFSITYLFTTSSYVYLYNEGRAIDNLSKIYFDGVELSPSIQFFNGSDWITSSKIPSETVFRISISFKPSRIDLVVNNEYILDIEVVS